MIPGAGGSDPRGARLLAAVGLFAVVVALQWWLVAAAGTDLPFQDEWNVQGQWLLPRWLGGEFTAADWVYPNNENRTFWTHATAILLLQLNGQWDPLVALVANAFVRAAAVAALFWFVSAPLAGRGRALLAAALAVAFLPHLAWHNALWAIESQVYFALLFAVLTAGWLLSPAGSGGNTVAGLGAALAGVFAMSPFALLLPAVLAMQAWRRHEARRDGRRALAGIPWLLLPLVGLAVMARVPVPAHEALRAATVDEFLWAAGRLLAWPHTAQPLAALAMNAPVLVLLGQRLGRRRRPVPGEDVVLTLALWAAAVALAGGWLRGGSDELLFGTPSRYADFLVLLPLANAWCLGTWWREAGMTRARVRFAALAWVAFAAVGWAGLTAEVMRGIVLPRARDPLAPVRLAQAFQQTRDPAVFAGQPRLLVAHPNPDAVARVLDDPRLRGHLPPSLQPRQPMGPLSRAARWLLRR